MSKANHPLSSQEIEEAAALGKRAREKNPDVSRCFFDIPLENVTDEDIRPVAYMLYDYFCRQHRECMSTMKSADELFTELLRSP